MKNKNHPSETLPIDNHCQTGLPLFSGGVFIMPSGQKGTKQKVLCYHCGEYFYPKNGNLSAKYCSLECKYKSQLGKHFKIKHPRPSTAKMTTSICKGCGKEFKHKVSAHPKYCDCWFRRKPKTVHFCSFCGIEFLEYESANKKYCSSVCYGSDLKITGIGERSNFWKGGVTKKSKRIRSGSDYKKWRNSVLERDNYTCTECGLSPVNKGYLHVHHIESFANNIIKRFDTSNGITLCFNCHQKKHKQKLIPPDYFYASVKRFNDYTAQGILF